LPAAVVLLFVAGLGAFWKTQQAQQGHPAGDLAQGSARKAPSPEAEVRRAAVHSGVVTSPSTAAPPQTQQTGGGSVTTAAALPGAATQGPAADERPASNASAGIVTADRQRGTPPPGGSQPARAVARANGETETAPMGPGSAALRDPVAPVRPAAARPSTGISMATTRTPVAEQAGQSVAAEPVRA
jgi:hypothetical protein